MSLRAGGGMGEVEIPVSVGRADDPMTLPRNHEEDTLFRFQDQTGIAVDSISWNDKMNAFRGTDMDATSAGMTLHAIRPNAGCIHDLVEP